MANEKKTEVVYKVTQTDLKKNESLLSNYDEKKKAVVFIMDENLPEDFAQELTELLGDDKISVSDVSQITPILNAINELQGLRMMESEPEVDPDEVKAIEKKFGIELGCGETWDSIYPVIEAGDFSEEDQEKIQKAIDKLIAKAHNDDYQNYKDAKKVLGSYNSALKEAKKQVKAPAMAFTKKVDSIFNLFAGQYTDVYAALDSNFEDALKREEEKKKAAEAKRNAATTKKMEELAEQNKALAEKMENQSEAIELGQIFNNTSYQIGKIHGGILTNIHTWNEEHIQNERKRLEELEFETVLDDTAWGMKDIMRLPDAQQGELLDQFEKAQEAWLRTLDNELEARKGKKIVQEYSDTGDLPDFAKAQVDVQIGETGGDLSEDELFIQFLGYMESLRQGFSNVDNWFRSVNFTEQPHIVKQGQILDKLFPKIGEMLIQTEQFALAHKQKYINEHKNQQL